MKTILLFFGFILFNIGNAQNINFPDPSFKLVLINSNINFDANYVISYPPIDANNDDEISVQEAASVIRLNLAYAQINNLEGLQFFINLKYFESYFSNFTTFNYPTLVNLEELNLINSVGTSPLVNVNLVANINLKKLSLYSLTTSLDLSNNINLRDVYIYSPNLTAFNVNNLVNLKNLSYYGKMATIDISDCINLLTLSCTGSSQSFFTPEENQLTSIDLSAQTRLVDLFIAGNNLTSLDLSNCPNLENVAISSNQITTLNIDNVDYVKTFYCDDNLLTSLNVDNMFNLQVLYCNNNQLTSLSTKNDIIEEFIYFFGNPNLASICCDDNEVVYMRNQCLQNNNDSTIVNSDCGSGSISISMYPNPVTDMLYFNTDARITKIEIFAMNGLMVMNSELVGDFINVQQLLSGMYFIKVYIGEEVANMKFIKA